MGHAIKAAENALAFNELPVGAALFYPPDVNQNNQDIYRYKKNIINHDWPCLLTAFNATHHTSHGAMHTKEMFTNSCRENRCHNPIAHAEIQLLNNAAAQGINLERSWIFVTLEPCIMCTYALKTARVSGVVFGCYQYAHPYIAPYSAHALPVEMPLAHHIPHCVGGVRDNECAAFLQTFFRLKRSCS